MSASTESMTAKAPARPDRAFMTALLLAVAVPGIWLARSTYRAGDAVGYNLGLIGGVAMLVLLLYPLAKRIRVLQRVLALKFWFRWHMILGIVGPLFIVLHSRLSFGSINGTVAFVAMSIVFTSGLIGRFVYAKIHHGLYGRKLSLNEVKGRLGMSGENARSKLRSFPELETELAALEERLLHQGERRSALLSLMSIALIGHLGYWRACRHFRQALARAAIRRQWDKATHARARQQGKRLIKAYIAAVKDVAQFGAYERLFSLWHLLHVPLMVILLFSGVVHVVAVHMY